MQRESAQIDWKPPKNGAVKVKFDGAFNSAQKRGGIRVLIVILNLNGEVIAKTSMVEFITNPFLAEAYAAVQALDFAHNIGFDNNIILKGDSLCSVKRLNGVGEGLI
ncbi:hypothetical protein PTKIN_Ptkin16aG0064900 [Pterospermum kingtungense]